MADRARLQMISYHHCTVFCDCMWHDCLLWTGMADVYTTATVHWHLGSVAGSVCVYVCVGYICDSTVCCYRSWHTMDSPTAFR